MASRALATMEQPVVDGQAMPESEAMTPEEQAEAQAATEAARRERLRNSLAATVQRLQVLAEAQVAKKSSTEERWYTDLRQYHGRYDLQTETSLKQANKSRMFVKLTRTRTLAWEARITDLLFPTDEKNWGIKPTPVPELAQKAREAEAAMEAKLAEANAMNEAGDPGHAEAASAAEEFAKQKTRLEQMVNEAKRRADLMEKTIEDQLVECRYPARCRDIIRDATKLGTGITKGPMVANRNRRQWTQKAGLGGTATWVLATVPDPNPEYVYVSPWNFYPDMDAREIAEAEFTFELHPYTATQVRALARQPGFDRDEVAKLLATNSKAPLPSYMTRLKEIVGNIEADEGRYLVWEYHGPLEREEALDIVEASGDTELLQALEADPLAEYRVILFFCEGHLLKFGIHPLDSGETLYSVFNFEKDDTSIFGFGVPFLMSDSQSSLNGAWRMTMDNAGLSVGPQVVIDKTQVEPEDGSWLLEPRKVWTRKASALMGSAPVFEVHNIPNNQSDLTAIIQLSRQFADDETSMPLIAQGEQAVHVTPTMGGMSILMNSANVIFRRVIKNFDDDITTPNLRRAYDWNMQFNPREEIKGDMSVDARGSSVLLVRELQATNLMRITSEWGGSPVHSRLLKLAPSMRKTVQALMISADEVILTDDEIATKEKAEAQAPKAPSPEEVKLQVAQIDADSRKAQAESAERIAEMNRQTEMMRLAEQRNMTMDELQAMLTKVDMENKSRERIMAAEVGAETQKRKEESAMGLQNTGSGGYV